MAKKQKVKKSREGEKLKEAYARIIKRDGAVKWIIHEKCKDK